jgi:hypothetical protein
MVGVFPPIYLEVLVVVPFLAQTVWIQITAVVEEVEVEV